MAATNLLRPAGANATGISSVTGRPPAVLPTFRLRALHPSSVAVGHGFNLQPDGRSALSAQCERAGPWTAVMCNDQMLETTFGGPDWVTAVVPPDVVTRPGRYRVCLSDEMLGLSNALELGVHPAAESVSGREPVDMRCVPPEARRSEQP